MTTNTAAANPPVRQDPRQVQNTLRRTLNWNDADVALATLRNSLPAGAFITDAYVEVVTAFDGATPTLSVGTNSASYNDIVATTDIDLTATGVYRVGRGLGRGIAAAADKPVKAKTTLSTPSQGQAVIVILFDGGWST